MSDRTNVGTVEDNNASVNRNANAMITKNPRRFSHMYPHPGTP